MKKFKRAFTIVELVIVIAVIAILAAVLIPTFSNIIRKANVSSDTQLVRNLNTALVVDKAMNGNHNTMQDALDAAYDAGYDLAKINARANQNEILWDSKNDVFCYYNDDKTGSVLDKIEYIPEFPGHNPVAQSEQYLFWKIFTNKDYDSENNTFTNENGFSVYYNGNDLLRVDVAVGFDSGESNVAVVNYASSAGQVVVIRTNGGTLTINAENDEVTHYGLVDYVDIIAVKPASYEERGTTSLIKVAKGNVALNSESKVGEIHFAKTGDEFTDIKVTLENGAKLPDLSRDPVGTSSLDNVLICEVVTSGTSEFYWLNAKGTIEDGEVLVSSTKTGEKTSATAENTTAVAIANAKTGTDQADDPGITVKAALEMTEEDLVEATASAAAKTFAEIGSKEELIAFRDAWNAGKIASGTFKLTANIDLSGIAWVPIGWGTDTLDRSFEGTFDGDGHTISGLTNKGVDYSELSYAANASNSGTAGAIYGFFGVVGGTTEIKNLILSNFNIEFSGTSSGKGVGALIGGAYYLKSQYGYKVNNAGTYSKNMDLTISNVNILNCIVKAGDKVGGLIGSGCYGNINKDESGNKTHQNINIVNCTINATVTANASSNARVGGLFGQWGSGNANSGGTQTLTVESTHINCIVYSTGTGNNQAAAVLGTINGGQNGVFTDLSGIIIDSTTSVSASGGSSNSAKNYYASGSTNNAPTLPSGEANQDW